MRWIKTLLLVVVLLVVLLLGLLFTLENDATVPLNLLLVEFPEQRLSTWMILSFFVGGILGLLASVTALLRLQASRLQIKRRLQALESRLQRDSGGGGA